MFLISKGQHAQSVLGHSLHCHADLHTLHLCHGNRFAPDCHKRAAFQKIVTGPLHIDRLVAAVPVYGCHVFSFRVKGDFMGTWILFL